MNCGRGRLRAIGAKMSDVERYTRQSQAMMRLAYGAPTPEERDAYLRIASAYVGLAADAARVPAGSFAEAAAPPPPWRAVG